MNAFNDFGNDEMVRDKEFEDYKVNGNTLAILVPAKCVLRLDIR